MLYCVMSHQKILELSRDVAQVQFHGIYVKFPGNHNVDWKAKTFHFIVVI